MVRNYYLLYTYLIKWEKIDKIEQCAEDVAHYVEEENDIEMTTDHPLPLAQTEACISLAQESE